MSNKPRVRSKLAKPAQEVAFQDLLGLLHKRQADVTAEEMLAIASNIVGKLVALQDQRYMTPAMAMEIVALNVENGNSQYTSLLMETKGTS